MFQEIREYSVAKLQLSANRHIGMRLSDSYERRAMGYLT